MAIVCGSVIIREVLPGLTSHVIKALPAVKCFLEQSQEFGKSCLGQLCRQKHSQPSIIMHLRSTDHVPAYLGFTCL